MMEAVSAADVARELAQACSIFLAWLLAASALRKLSSPARGMLAARELLGVSVGAGSAALVCAAATEAAAAVLLCIPAVQLLGTLLAAGVFLVYSSALAWAVLQGRRNLDCGCTLSANRRPLGWSQIAKAGSLCVLASACAALLLSLGGSAPSGSTTLAGLTGLALYFAAEQLDSVVPLRSGALS